MMSDKDKVTPSYPLPKPHENKQLQTVALSPERSPADYLEAMQLADEVAKEQLGSHMLISWYDADRDFESPQHAGECHLDSGVPGYVDYALYRNATLKVDIEQGRFVFFYLDVDF
jgi:hypothetical protein